MRASFENPLATSSYGPDETITILDIGQRRLTRLWDSHGKTTEARDLLAPIYGWFSDRRP